MKKLLTLLAFLMPFTALAADPTLKITAPVQTLVIGQTTTLTFTFSEPVTGFTLSDIVVKGDAVVSAFAGSGAVYTATLQKLITLDAISVNVDNNATTPAGHGSNLGFNVAPKVFIKEGNTFLGKLIEAVPQPRCMLPGEYLADSAGNPTTPMDEKYFTIRSIDRKVNVIQELRNTCLTRLVGGLQYLKKANPAVFETNNVHGVHNHTSLMSKVQLTQINPAVGTTKLRIRPAQNCGLSGGVYNCTGSGDFRANNVAAKIDFDDPIVYPDQKGKAHAHTFFGNANVNYQTNSASLIKSCVSLFSGGIANCTGYWMPSMIDTAFQMALIPREILLYYKAVDVRFMPYIEPLPQGLKIIAGNPGANSLATRTDSAYFICRDALKGDPDVYDEIIPNCSGDKYRTLRAVVDFPTCVADDGTGKMQLDSPNHRSHLANPDASKTNGCPDSHPHRIAHISQLADYPIARGQTTATWRLSSDNYASTIPGGWSSHADWWGGWQPAWAARMNDQCNKTLTNCGVDYIGLNAGIPITNITTSGNIATLTTAYPHLLTLSDPVTGNYKFTGTNQTEPLRGRLSGVTGASAATYNFVPAEVTTFHAQHPNPAGTIVPHGSQTLKVTGATEIQITLPTTPSTPINGAVTGVKLQWGESLCPVRVNCDQAYSDLWGLQ